MSEPLNVALIGAGRIAQEAHLPVWAERPDATLRWVVDTREEAARSTAEAWGVPHWGTDYRRALEDQELDAVDVCTPAITHREICEAFLRRGLHVLVEKPAALSLEDLREMQQAAEASGAVLMVAENWPFSSAAVRVEAIVKGDNPWRPILLQARHESGLRLPPPVPPERDMGDRNWLGYLFAAGIHSLNLARYLVGEFDALSAFATSSRPGPYFPLDDDVVVAVRFSEGAIGSFSFTGRSRHVGERRLSFRLIADQGVLEFDILSGRVEVHLGGQQTVYEDPNPSLGYREEIAHFLDCIADRKEPLTSAGDQLRTLAVVLAAYRSLETGGVVSPASLLAGAS